jgi:membrane fusion protein, multidrug efflux system
LSSVEGAAVASSPQAGRSALPVWIGRVGGLAALAAAAFVLFVCITHWDAWAGAARHQRTDDAYLQTDLTPIAARVAGYVVSVPAQDFQTVHAGQLLAQIEDADYRAAAAQAQANAEVARAAIGNLQAQEGLQKANIEAADATIVAAAATADRAGKAQRRQHVLLSTGSGSQDQVEAADAAELSTTADLARDRAARKAAAQQLVVLQAQVEQAKAALQAAQAAADLARINLGYTRIVAPQDGVLGQRQVRPGQYLAVGGQVTTLSPIPKVWVIANYKETQLTRIRPGQAATVTVDAYPGRRMKGHVLDYAPASGAQFSLLPPDNATGNFTKIVQRVAVKILIDDADGLETLLRPGMSVIADVDTGRR